MTFGELGAPTISQNAALPAAVAMPTPEGPPLTSLVTSTAFGVAGQRLDAAQLWPARTADGRSSPWSCEQGLQRAGAAAKSQRVDRQHGDLRIDVIALVAGGFEFALQRLAHDHPQRVAGGDVVAAGQHELVAEGMLGTAVVVAHAAQFRPGQVRRDVEGRVGQRPAEVPGLRIIPEQHQGHAGHVPDVFQAFPVERRVQRFNGG